MRFVRQRADRWTATSRVLTGLDAARETLTQWVDDAEVVATAETASARFVAVTRVSYWYRWLTAEPEPEVVVIDLQETYTVGPLIAALDPVARMLAPPIRETLPLWRQTRTQAALAWLAHVVAASRTRRLLIAALEPPEAGSRAEEDS